MRSRIGTLIETLRASFFFIPVLFMLGGIGLAVFMLFLHERDIVIWDAWRTTADSARAVLSTVATATMTVAGITFSVSLLLLQLSSSQYSPRILQQLFRDRRTKYVIGLVIATFTYCLVVLRAVHGGLEVGADGEVPHAAIAAATALGIASVIAIIGFINHIAHSMEVGELIRRIFVDTRDLILRTCPPPGGALPTRATEPVEDRAEIRAPRMGYIQRLEREHLLSVCPANATVWVRSFPGEFVSEGQVMAVVSPACDDVEQLLDAFVIGRARTISQDFAFGIRQMVDVAVRALSPGTNDPTTAREVVAYLGGAFRELFLRDLPPNDLRGEGGRRVIVDDTRTHADHLVQAFAEIRQWGAAHVSLVTGLLEALSVVRRAVEQEGMPERAEPLYAEAARVLEVMERSEMHATEKERVREVARATGMVRETPGWAVGA